MWGAASILFRFARCSGTPVWARGGRSSRRSPHRVAVPSWGGGRPPGSGGAEGRARGSPAGGVGGGGGGAAPPPALGPEWEGGGEWGGASGPLATPPDGREGGGMAVPAPGASHRLGGRALPPPPST